VVRAAERFRDERERQAAVDRLSPPSPNRSSPGGALDRNSTGSGSGSSEDDAGPPRPPPQITRAPGKVRPKRFKDAVKGANGGLGLNPRPARLPKKDGSAWQPGEESDEEDPRLAARKRRIERQQSASKRAETDRLNYLVAVIKQELGKPSLLLALDGKTRDIRFASLYYRLRNFGDSEIFFALVQYYWVHWNDDYEWETEEKEKAVAATLEAAANAVEGESAEEKRPREAAAAEAGIVVVDRMPAESSGGDGGGGGGDKDTDAERPEAGSAYGWASKKTGAEDTEDEKVRRALLEAALLRIKGEPGSSSKGKGKKKEGEDRGVVDLLADLVRDYFSVEFIDDGEGGEEIVVMTTTEFIVVMLVLIGLSSRLGHYLITTYVIHAAALDPLLR